MRRGHTLPREAATCALLAAWLCACSTSVGGAGSYVVGDPNIAAVGSRATTMVDLQAFNFPSMALGLDSRLLTRVGERDDFAQWRLSVLAGFDHIPQPHHFPIGWEALASVGGARVYTGEQPGLRFTYGGQLGFPIRLACSRPIWRSDDFAALGVYLVPSFGVRDVVNGPWEADAALMLRLHLWGAAFP